MSDQIELKEGILPWEPPHAETVDILNTWEFPLSGLVYQFGQTFFFLCLQGEVASANLWGYVPVDAREAETLVKVHTHDVFEKLAQGGRVWIAALSVGDQGILRWAPVEDQHDGESAMSAALRSLKMSEEDLDRLLATA